ncbi:hypothetical protein VTJ49DRAFT_2804 [Mycothermus thermophilus]|uniref:Uncharacterized protein n=1 Tax=Humicola insolens TaxID=85995 RepID=A0ABR3V909_HUMIN
MPVRGRPRHFRAVALSGACPSSRRTHPFVKTASTSRAALSGGEEEDLAMEALRNIITNVPEWLHKLDELDSQIAQRQIELAKWAQENEKKSGPKSIRNKGSTESLRPRDEPEAHPSDPTSPPPSTPPQKAADDAAAKTGAKEPPVPPSPSDSQTPSAVQRQASQMRAAGQARARATLRKRHRTDSMLSAEGAAPKYRSRSMIIVYYDSYVQEIFENLVKFVSSSRNLMRKAKTAARFAQIKRMAELETPDDDANANANSNPTSTSPGDGPIAAADPAEAASEMPLPFVSTRRMGPGSGYVPRTAAFARAGARGTGRGGAPSILGGGPPDVYDELDKGLEYVQSMCEQAAHQFLRDGDCNEEVNKIKKRLAETKELADKEMERVKREDPAALQRLGDDDATKSRSYRTPSMRRDPAPKPGAPVAAAIAAATGPLEVDEGVEDVDDAPLKLPPFRSTRMMRGPGGANGAN